MRVAHWAVQLITRTRVCKTRESKMLLEHYQASWRPLSYSNPQPMQCQMRNAASNLLSDHQCHPGATNAQLYRV